MSNEDLAQMIRDVSAAVDNCNQDTVVETVKALREHITPNCHEGCGAQMDGTDTGYKLQLEWFAGQLLAMVDKKQWFGINTWINCTSKFTTRAAGGTHENVLH